MLHEKTIVRMATKQNKKKTEEKRYLIEGGLLIVTNLHYSLSETKNKQIL